MTRGDAKIRLELEGEKRVTSGLKRVSGAVKGLVGGLAALGAIHSLKKIASEAFDLAEGFAATSTAVDTFRGLASKAGISADDMLQRIREASNKALSTFDAAAIGVRALNAELDPDKLLVAIQYTKRFAESTGKEFSQLWQLVETSFVSRVGRSLRQLGIDVSDGADLMGRATDVMAEKMDALGIKGDDAGLSMERLRASFRDVQDQLGEVIHVPVVRFLDHIANALDRISKTGLEQRIEDLREMGYTAEQLRDLTDQVAIERISKQLESAESRLKSFEASGGADQKALGISARRDLERLAAEEMAGIESEQTFRLLVGDLAQTRDLNRINLELEKRRQDALEDTSGIIYKQWQELGELRNTIMEVNRLEEQRTGIIAGDNAGAGGGAGPAPPVTAPSDPAALDSNVAAGETSALVDRFRRENKMMDAQVEAGSKTLADARALVNAWAALLSTTESGELELLQRRNDLTGRVSAQRERESGELLNLTEATIQEILANDAMAWEKRVAQAKLYARTIRENFDEELTAADEDRLRGETSDLILQGGQIAQDRILESGAGSREDRLLQAREMNRELLQMEELTAEGRIQLEERIARLDEQLNEERIAQWDRVRDVYDRTIGDALRNQMRLLLDGKASWQDFGRTVLQQLAMIMLEMMVLQPMVDSLTNAEFSGGKGGIMTGGGMLGSLLGAALGSVIPGFAEGGVVNGPTLAMVGERGKEWMIPDRDLRALVQSLSGGWRVPQMPQQAPVVNVVIEGEAGDLMRWHEKNQQAARVYQQTVR